MSSLSFSPISVFEGSSSSSTTTIGAWFTPPIVRAWASSGKATLEIGSVNRNRQRKITGTGDSTRRKDRTGSARAYRAATPAPIRTETTIITRSDASIDFLSAWAAISATSPAISTRCAAWRASGPASPISSSIASSTAGGATTTSTDQLITSKPDEPRAAKNSGLSLSRSNSGCATANVHSTARPRYAHSASRSAGSRPAEVIPASGGRSRAPACPTPGALSARRRTPHPECARSSRARSRGAARRAWARAAS